MMCLCASYKKKKNIYINIVLASLKSMKTGVGSISQRYGPGIWIRFRNKCHGSPNTAFKHAYRILT